MHARANNHSVASATKAAAPGRGGAEYLIRRIESRRFALYQQRPRRYVVAAFTGQTPFGRRNASAYKPTDPPATALDGEIPKGYPLAFLLSGTRHMCLSQAVPLHRKLRKAGIEADLNVFENMWYVFWENPDLTESREAIAELARFFDRHLQ
jgi:acetyl esterase/lipase